MLDIVVPTFNNATGCSKLFSNVDSEIDGVNFYVIDDSSTDEVRDFFARPSLACRTDIFYTRNSVPNGVPGNWSAGLALGSSQYKWLLLHDEWISRSELKKILKLLEEHSPDVLINDIAVLNPDCSVKKKIRNSEIKIAIVRHWPAAAVFSNFFGTTGAFVMKESKVAKFDQNLKWFVDVDWFARNIARKGSVMASGCSICSMPHYESSITASLESDLSRIAASERSYLVAKHKIKFAVAHRFLSSMMVVIMKLAGVL